MIIAAMKAHRSGLLSGVRKRKANGTTNIHYKKNSQPCHASGNPQPKP
jgi:hypothetical protein